MFSSGTIKYLNHLFFRLHRVQTIASQAKVRDHHQTGSAEGQAGDVSMTSDGGKETSGEKMTTSLSNSALPSASSATAGASDPVRNLKTQELQSIRDAIQSAMANSQQKEGEATLFSGDTTSTISPPSPQETGKSK